MKKKRKIFVLIAAYAVFSIAPAFAGVKHYDTTFSGNYGIPDHQDGFLSEEYDERVGVKLQRGLKNFFLGWLEVPHGVKTEVQHRKAEYLPVGFETYPLGILKGAYKWAGRTAVGFYEVVTFPYAQGPIIEEMEEWLY